MQLTKVVIHILDTMNPRNTMPGQCGCSIDKGLATGTARRGLSACQRRPSCSTRCMHECCLNSLQGPPPPPKKKIFITKS